MGLVAGDESSARDGLARFLETFFDAPFGGVDRALLARFFVDLFAAFLADFAVDFAFLAVFRDGFVDAPFAAAFFVLFFVAIGTRGTLSESPILATVGRTPSQSELPLRQGVGPKRTA